MFSPAQSNITANQLAAMNKGSLIVGRGVSSTNTTLAAGSDNLPLVADSNQTEGVKYALLGVSGGGTGASTVAGALSSLGLTSVPTLLSTVTGIDLKNTGQTTLYTVPAASTLFITDIILRTTTVSGSISVATVRVGKANAYTEWLGATALTGLTSSGLFVSLATASLLSVHATFAATEVVKLDVTIGASATTSTATAYVYGFTI